MPAWLTWHCAANCSVTARPSLRCAPSCLCGSFSRVSLAFVHDEAGSTPRLSCVKGDTSVPAQFQSPADLQQQWWPLKASPVLTLARPRTGCPPGFQRPCGWASPPTSSSLRLPPYSPGLDQLVQPLMAAMPSALAPLRLLTGLAGIEEASWRMGSMPVACRKSLRLNTKQSYWLSKSWRTRRQQSEAMAFPLGHRPA